MSFTKVAPAGIGTEPGNSILIGDSLLHSTGIDIGSNTGIGVTIRKHGDATFTGIITASAFFGDGSGLEGVSSSGIGTPLSDDDTSDLNKIYYVNQELSIGSTVTVNHPSSAVASYTHYQDLVVTDDADFIVSDGDTFIPDVLGIRTSTSTISSASGGRIRAGTITNAGANGAVNFPNGLTGTAGTFTGNLNVSGVLTYEDVTNVDSIGVITARSGVRIGTGGTVGPVGSGIVTYFGDGSQLTGVGGIGTEGSVNTSGIITATAFVPTTGQLSHRNIIVNGAMTVAQRGQSSTSSNAFTCDRFKHWYQGADEAPTFSQHALTSSDTGPWEEGFRYSFHTLNGNQTGGAGASDYIEIDHELESQVIANSGWNYLSTSGNITLSFWVKASVSQKYSFIFRTKHGTSYSYLMETPTLSANTWTKVTKTIPGNSNLRFDNDVSSGMTIVWFPFIGTTYTDAGNPTETWGAFSSTRWSTPMTSTWWTTNDSTFEFTGVQLEVGPVATPFEHLSYGDELRRCQRYFHIIKTGSGEDRYVGQLQVYGSGHCHGKYFHFPVTMRTTPTTTLSGTITPTNASGNFSSNFTSATFDRNTTEFVGSNNTSGSSGLTAGNAAAIALRQNSSISSSAEL